LVTIREEFGRLHGIHTLYIGERNNTAAALALAVSMTPRMKLTLVTPEGYGLPESVLEKSRRLARQHDASIEQHHQIEELPTRVDAVYATR
jgi:ornithine carbamoyltransferase